MPTKSIPPSGDVTKVQSSLALPSSRVGAHPVVVWKDMKGSHTYTLRDRTLIGSAPAAGITISDPAVSRIHAELELRNDGVWVKDLGSRNGTFVDGRRIEGEAIIQGSAELRFGGIKLTFSPGGAGETGARTSKLRERETA